jgi:hypothetical protein
MDREEFLAKEMGWSYVIDDSKMPSAKESKKIVIPPDLRERLREGRDEIAHKYGLY